MVCNPRRDIRNVEEFIGKGRCSDLIVFGERPGINVETLRTRVSDHQVWYIGSCVVDGEGNGHGLQDHVSGIPELQINALTSSMKRERSESFPGYGAL